VSDLPDLTERARAWAAEDPDPETRAELEALLQRDDPAAREDLADRFGGTLEFGTAGLRGELGAGSNRMNRVVVTRAAAGLAAYLREHSLKDHGAGRDASVVIGYDARHHSDVFARDTAEVMTGAGLRALVLPRPLPTPVLAFAIRELGCVAGVMVTASHNPPRDNGYKVYLGDGSQIVPPADAEIAARIDAVGALADVPRGDGWRVLGEDVVDAYLDTVAGLAGDGPRDLRLVYTPLHGVGGTSVVQVLETAGFEAPHVVSQQEQPDPDFPTVSFPNPEEPGAMDLAVALAAEHRADLVVANDPDADRCAAAVPDAHGWRMLRGDEVGALLAHHLLSLGREGTYACSIVSSSLLGKLAAAAGQPFAETLTGFKWISKVDGLVFGYEEALGYCVDPEHVKDKDGVSALLLLCELAALEKARGRTLVDVLDDLAVAHGLHATDQLSVRVTDLSRIAAAMEPAADRGPALPAGGRGAGRRAAQRHRAEAEVLPRGRHSGRRRGGRRRRPDLGRRTPGRPAGRHQDGRGHLAPRIGQGVGRCSSPPTTSTSRSARRIWHGWGWRRRRRRSRP
jgi:phosphomannomutase